MQVIGFNLHKISAEKKSKTLETGSIDNNITFTELEKDKIKLLKEEEAIRLTFRYELKYFKKDKTEQAAIQFEGDMLISASKDESKDILKSWKNKEIPMGFRVTLYNIILKKVSTRASLVAEEIGLPSHLALPQIRRELKKEQ